MTIDELIKACEEFDRNIETFEKLLADEPELPKLPPGLPPELVDRMRKLHADAAEIRRQFQPLLASTQPSADVAPGMNTMQDADASRRLPPGCEGHFRSAVEMSSDELPDLD